MRQKSNNFNPLLTFGLNSESDSFICTLGRRDIFESHTHTHIHKKHYKKEK